MKPIGVIKEVKITLDGRRQEFACALLARSPDHLVVFYRLPERRRVGRLVLPRRTETFGYFWRGRPYNVYHWLTPRGQTLGFYVNLCAEVEFHPQEVRWRDLGLDLLFSADGASVQILDEAEVASAPPEVRAAVWEARRHVLTHRDEILAEVRGATAHLRGGGRRPAAEESLPRARRHQR
ncbi:MAG TPA: DUF402 domain-containing protein [bacterium]|nr:DUF402 domain-containing protein [bacterium]